MSQTQKDRPWLIRTYAGHSTAEASNALYRSNLEKGQTGLSVAFDLPTQTGYDSDHVLSRGEVGKVGVPVGHLGDMRALFDQSPSKNEYVDDDHATAPWLCRSILPWPRNRRGRLQASRHGAERPDQGISLARHLYLPARALAQDDRRRGRVLLYQRAQMEPMNVCSYHLQEAGATPEQELSFALATGIAVLDALKPRVPDEDFPALCGRISFFVNAGIRFVTEMCKMRAFVDLWDEILETRYGVENPKFRRFRYGVQVNSLGLTEQQPENNVYRILIEMLAVTLSKKARARAVQLPAWNEALGLPRPWDQQWSMRMQQIMAYETDLLEYDDCSTTIPPSTRRSPNSRKARVTSWPTSIQWVVPLAPSTT